MLFATCTVCGYRFKSSIIDFGPDFSGKANISGNVESCQKPWCRGAALTDNVVITARDGVREIVGEKWVSPGRVAKISSVLKEAKAANVSTSVALKMVVEAEPEAKNLVDRYGIFGLQFLLTILTAISVYLQWEVSSSSLSKDDIVEEVLDHIATTYEDAVMTVPRPSDNSRPLTVPVPPNRPTAGIPSASKVSANKESSDVKAGGKPHPGAENRAARRAKAAEKRRRKRHSRFPTYR